MNVRQHPSVQEAVMTEHPQTEHPETEHPDHELEVLEDDQTVPPRPEEDIADATREPAEPVSQSQTDEDVRPIGS